MASSQRSSSSTRQAKSAACRCSLAAAAVVNVANFVSAKLKNKPNNYKSWKAQMLCLIESQDLLGYIDGEISPPPPPDDGKRNSKKYVAWRRTDQLVKGWILGALSDKVVDSVVDTVVDLDMSARDVWFELEKAFADHEIISDSSSTPQDQGPKPQQGKDSKEYLPLFRAAHKGEWVVAKQILDQDPDAIRATRGDTLETALHIAVGTGKATYFVQKLVDLMDDDVLKLQEVTGCNALHIAAMMGNTPEARILVHRLKDLLYMQTCNGEFPVEQAAIYGHRETLELLVSETKDDYMDVNPFAGKTGVNLVNNLIYGNFFDIAMDLVDKYPYLATTPDEDGGWALETASLKDLSFLSGARFNFWEHLLYSNIQLEVVKQHATPNSAADIEDPAACTTLACGEFRRWHGVFHNLHFTLCKVIKQLVPQVKRIHDKKLMHHQALELVKCLCKHIGTLSYNEAGEIYLQAITTAACSGISEVIELIVQVFPAAIYDSDSATEETIFHTAVKNRCEKIFNLFYQSSNHKNWFTNAVDSSGNTMLHIAAHLAPPHKLNQVSGAALQMQREIQWYKEVEKMVHPYNRSWTNNAEKTPEMIFTEEHRSLKIEGEKWMKDTANSCTIAAALIATVVFAAAITVPGGNESNTGYPMLFNSAAFIVFAVSDAVSLFTSTTSLLMFLSMLTSRYAEEDFLYALPKRLCIGLFTLFVSILFMMVAFSCTLYLVFGRKNSWVLVPVAALACLPISSFMLLQFPLLVDVVSLTYGRGIFGKQSNQPFY